jgi:hypothetical protein
VIFAPALTLRSKQESPVREIRTLGLTWRELETGLRID